MQKMPRSQMSSFHNRCKIEAKTDSESEFRALRVPHLAPSGGKDGQEANSCTDRSIVTSPVAQDHSVETDPERGIRKGFLGEVR